MSTDEIISFLDWLVSLDIQHYKTVSFPDYTPSGASHFYLKGAPGRFTSADMVEIYFETANKELTKRWQDALIGHADFWKRRPQIKDYTQNWIPDDNSNTVE